MAPSVFLLCLSLTKTAEMIYHISCPKHSEIRLFRSNPQVFRVVSPGEFVPLLVGFGYSLINKMYLEPFQAIPETELSILPTTLQRVSTGEQWDNYANLLIAHSISPDTIGEQDHENQHIWTFDGHVFLSEKVKHAVENRYQGIFEFTEGFSQFA